MGKFTDKYNQAKDVVKEKYDERAILEEGAIDEDDFKDVKDDFDDNLDVDKYDDVSVQQAQKPESFHHFLLENQHQDLELLIRGYKKVFNKELNKWDTRRNKIHCFTDEESEHILRIAQAYLSTDIKLSYISVDNFSKKMLMIFDELEGYFFDIAECKYGRYKDSSEQYFMKLDNLNIFAILMARIEANFSRAIKGQENKHTHNAVKGQESLNNSAQDMSGDKGYY